VVTLQAKKRQRRREFVERALSTLEGAPVHLGMSRAKRTETAYINLIGLGLSVLLMIILILLSFWLLRRRARRTTATTSIPEEREEDTLPFKSTEGKAEFLAAYEDTLKLWPVAYEPMDITGRYGRTHLVACGPKDAPSLVLLHMYFTSLTQWAANAADLSQDYRVYAIDVMGQPSRSIPDQPIKSREDFVAWLSEILDALDIESTNLVGASYGGWLTLNYAIGAPERVDKIALLSPAGGLVPLVKQFYVRAMLMGFFPRRFLVDSFVRWSTYEENMRDPTTRALWGDCLANQMYLGLRHFRTRAGVGPDAFSDEELRGIQVPTLLLIGQQEAYYDPVAALERARRLIPNFEGELVSQANHDMTISKHAIVDRGVLEFLKGNTPHPQSVEANG
jgi:pimeloyl-ACP methyl ester carboxylesterase